MIITTSKHGRTRRDGRRLSKHLKKTENELALLIEIGNCLAETLPEMIEVSKIYQAASSARASLHHLSVNPAADLSREQLLDAVHRVRIELDPTGGRPFAIIVHKKKRAEPGGSAEHAHLVLAAVDEKGKALDDKFTKIRTERLAREIEYDLQKKFGVPETAVLGRHFKSSVKALWKTRPEVAVWLEQTFGPNPPKPNSAISPRARGRARAQGFDLPEMKAAVRKAWVAGEKDIAAFQDHLEKVGLTLRRGDKPGVWIVLDRQDRLVGSANRLLRMKLGEFQTLMEVKSERDCGAKPVTHDHSPRSPDPRGRERYIEQDRSLAFPAGTGAEQPGGRSGGADRESPAADRGEPEPARASPRGGATEIGLGHRDYNRARALRRLRRLDCRPLLSLVHLATMIPYSHFDHSDQLRIIGGADPPHTDLWGIGQLPKPR